MTRLFWRLLWTASVRLTGPSRLAVWIEDRYVEAAADAADAEWFSGRGER